MSPRERESAAPAALLLEAGGMSLAYNSDEILGGVDLAIREGDFLGLLGRNGAGKTTLLRGLLGLLPPRRGILRRHRVRGEALRLGYVPQRENLDPIFPLALREVVEMGAYGSLAPLGRLPRGTRQRTAQALAEVELEDKIRATFAALSGGQRQRALIARALVHDPHLLLLDEPTSGVDLPSSEAIMELLGRLNRERGLAIVLVSHHLHGVREAVREVVWVARGGISRGPTVEMMTPRRIEEMIA